MVLISDLVSLTQLFRKALCWTNNCDILYVLIRILVFASDKLYSHGFKQKENEVIDLCNYEIEVHISSIGPKESIFQFLSLSSVSFMRVGFIHSYTRQLFPIGEGVQCGMHLWTLGLKISEENKSTFPHTRGREILGKMWFQPGSVPFSVAIT